MRTITKAWAALKGWFGLDALAGSGVSYVGGSKRLTPGEDQSRDGNTIVMSCLVSIVEAFVDAPPAVTATTSKDGLDEYDHSTAFAGVMRAPSPLQKISGRRMMKAAVASYEIDGNAYLDLVKDLTGTVREIVWMPPWSVVPVADRSGLLSHYDVRMDDGTTQRRAPDEVCHVANGIDPKNKLKGRSPVRVLLSQILTDNECDAYTAEVIVNPAIVGWAVIPKGEDGGIDPDDAELAETKINAKFGRGGRGGAMVFHTPADVKTLGFSPAELAIDKMRRTPEARISGVMNVPAIVAGLEVGLDKSTFANTEQARKYFARYKMAPLWDVFAEEFSTQILPMCEGYKDGQKAAYDTRRIKDLQEDEDAVHTRARENWMADLVTRSVALSMIGQKPTPRDDVYYSEVAAAAPAKKLADTKARLDDRRRVASALRQDDGGDEA